MSSEIIHQIVKTIEGEVISRPSPLEFEMAYQQKLWGPKVEQSGGNRRPHEADPGYWEFVARSRNRATR